MSGHLNNFGYVRGLPNAPTLPAPPGDPGGVPAVTLIQPGVPQTMGEKNIRHAQTEVAVTRAMVGQPDPPKPAPIVWTQTRATAATSLELSRSRTAMLSEKMA